MNPPSAEMVEQFEGKKVVVIGDLVADQFLSGTIARVSREAPVFILRHEDTQTYPGAAANAAANISALGGTPILVGTIGSDPEGRLLRSALTSSGVNCDRIVETSQRTTTKLRVLAGQHYAQRQQVIRIDFEGSSGSDKEVNERIIEHIQAAASEAHAIVISDYGYGVIGSRVFETALAISREKQIALIVDSRFRLADLGGATSATPNQEEVENLLGESFTDEDCVRLADRLGFDSLLVTRGNQGMLLCQKDRDAISIDAVGSLEPIDVTGAGDTVIAAYSLGIAAGLGFESSARIANHAGGIVVMKKGTATVTATELIRSISRAEKDPISGSAAF